jgi:hypothetical protein
LEVKERMEKKRGGEKKRRKTSFFLALYCFPFWKGTAMYQQMSVVCMGQ